MGYENDGNRFNDPDGRGTAFEVQQRKDQGVSDHENDAPPKRSPVGTILGFILIAAGLAAAASHLKREA